MTCRGTKDGRSSNGPAPLPCTPRGKEGEGGAPQAPLHTAGGLKGHTGHHTPRTMPQQGEGWSSPDTPGCHHPPPRQKPPQQRPGQKTHDRPQQPGAHASDRAHTGHRAPHGTPRTRAHVKRTRLGLTCTLLEGSRLFLIAQNGRLRLTNA